MDCVSKDGWTILSGESVVSGGLTVVVVVMFEGRMLIFGLQFKLSIARLLVNVMGKRKKERLREKDRQRDSDIGKEKTHN